MCLFQFWFPQSICLRVGLLSHMVVLLLVFKESPYCPPQWLYQLMASPTVQERSLFSTPSPAFVVYRLFDDGHSDWCEMIPHCIFDLHFSNEQYSASFHVFISHLETDDFIFLFFSNTAAQSGTQWCIIFVLLDFLTSKIKL